MANRKDIIEKILNLRAKADNAGATEAEAMAAADMAARLLIKHDIRPEELAEVQKEGAVDKGFRQGKALHPVLWGCFRGIKKFTETKAYESNGELRFIGVESDVLMAVYLSEFFVGVAKRLWREYHATVEHLPFKQQIAKREALFYGLGLRLSERLLELHEARQSARASDTASAGTALVVLKDQLIKDKMKESGLVLRKKRNSGNKSLDDKALRDGHSHGNTVSISRPLNGGSATGELA